MHAQAETTPVKVYEKTKKPVLSKSKIIDVLKLNETVQVVDSVNGWYNITDNDLNSGYLSKKYINKTAKVSIIKEESFFSDNVIYIIFNKIPRA